MNRSNATPPSPDPYEESRDYGREMPSAPVLKPLESVCACVGSSVVFHCIFYEPEYLYSYVVWTVGNHIIERSNCRFRVMHKAGDHLLYIPQYLLSMSGEVSCELRYSIPQRHSVLINRTTAQLTAVSRLTARQLPQVPQPDGRRRRQDSPGGAHSAGPQNQTMAHDLYIMTPMSSIGVPFYITYCRFPDGYNFLYVTINGMVITRHVTVLVMADEFGFSNVVEDEGEPYANIIFQWDRFIYPLPIQSQYGIEIMDDHNRYVQLGVTSIPAVEVAGLRFETILKLRVRLLGAFFGVMPDSSIRVHLCGASQSPTRYISMGNWDIFKQLYSAADDVIGSGGFGQVSLVRKTAGHVEQLYAAKAVFLSTKSTKNNGAGTEYEIMASLSHSRVVQLVDAFMGCNCMTIVMEYLWGGELFERILEEDIEETDIIPYVRQICEGLEYLHSKSIVHLDIKPENIMCVHPNSCDIKIIDFGLARKLVDGEQIRTIYGTRDYIAPEVLNFDVLTRKCDMWSLGVLTYVLLSGIVPFDGITWIERASNIQLANYNYDDEVFTEISNQARDFIDALLLVNPRNRMPASEALQHPWLDEVYTSAMRVPMKRAQSNLKKYLATRARWQRAHTIIKAAFRFRILGGLPQIQEESSAEVSQP